MRRLSRSLILFCLTATSLLWAHDPEQGWTEVRLQKDYMLVKFTIAARSAEMLVKNHEKSDTPAPEIQQDTFATVLPRLQKAAVDIFHIDSNGKALSCDDSDITLTVERDVEFKLFYPRPAEGSMTLQADYLKGMPDTFGTNLSVFDESKKLLCWRDNLYLGAESATFNVPSIPAPKKDQP